MHIHITDIVLTATSATVSSLATVAVMMDVGPGLAAVLTSAVAAIVAAVVGIYNARTKASSSSVNTVAADLKATASVVQEVKKDVNSGSQQMRDKQNATDQKVTEMAAVILDLTKRLSASEAKNPRADAPPNIQT